ncbi:MAG: hypothetical protein H2038_07745 [Brevundimonas sp.]|uniref:hypothetical protein n=1 Tax=Brevundimonas sp. TaxID=1871086 RepID=UPI00181D75A6|nr:hypothetical protein [Brevundimonas sp.]MBA4804524.1 hypothetical protein [Brevundimonas sp.]
MSYGADYVTADPANAPLDAPLLVGADPVLWLALALLLLAAGLFGWWLGARRPSGGRDATAAIWKAIDAAAKEAMKADDHALRGQAQKLAEALDRRLGHTLAISGGDKGLGRRIAALRAALAGEADPAHAHDHRPHGGAHEAHEAGGHDGHGAPGERPADSPHPATIASAITINVSGGAAVTHDHAGHDKPGHDRPGPHGAREMTAREQTDALRLAVAAFNEHWRHEARRTGELRAALAELSGAAGDGSSSGSA